MAKSNRNKKENKEESRHRSDNNPPRYYPNNRNNGSASPAPMAMPMPLTMPIGMQLPLQSPMPMPFPIPVPLAAMPMPYVPMGYYYNHPGQQQLMYQNPLATAMATRYFYNSLLTTAAASIYPSRYEDGSPSSVANSDDNAVAPRGPPKKPPQSDYAIWVGNLNPETTILDMCNAFGTEDIQSIFLIRQTKCAFVNYASEEAVQKGMNRFQERFYGTLRGNQLCVKRQVVATENSDLESTAPEPGDGAAAGDENGDRFFVCKSLTVGDLEVARRLEVWATQPKNEDKLNHAFRTSPNVYLFFSANRTGEFFGVARMESEITYQKRPSELATPRASQPTTPSPDTASPPLCLPSDPAVPGLGIVGYRPVAITPTPADPSVPIPSGRIVDDAARGNLFWERWSDDNDINEPIETTNHLNNDDYDAYDESSSTEDKIKTFRIKWLSFTRVPFFLTNGIHNRLNKNKPVKIGRDGTEIDRETGKQLLHLFKLDS